VENVKHEAKDRFFGAHLGFDCAFVHKRAGMLVLLAGAGWE